jgi:diacylglycerol kinase
MDNGSLAVLAIIVLVVVVAVTLVWRDARRY